MPKIEIGDKVLWHDSKNDKIKLEVTVKDLKTTTAKKGRGGKKIIETLHVLVSYATSSGIEKEKWVLGEHVSKIA